MLLGIDCYFICALSEIKRKLEELVTIARKKTCP